MKNTATAQRNPAQSDVPADVFANDGLSSATPADGTSLSHGNADGSEPATDATAAPVIAGPSVVTVTESTATVSTTSGNEVMAQLAPEHA